jgi:DNA mismatch repair protein MutS2
MIYPANFEHKIGFDKIRSMLEQQCLSPLGRDHVRRMKFVAGHAVIQELIGRAEEFRQILLSGKPFPNSGYFDLTAELKRIMLKGTYLDPETMFDLKSSLHTINDCLDFFRAAEDGRYPELTKLTEGLEPHYDLVDAIDRIVDERGMIRDSASPGLKKIRAEQRSKHQAIDVRIRKSMEEARKSGLSPDDAEVTIRSGRMVIPVLASAKRQLKGFIHDESATGQTVYIEPTEVFDLNNEIRELENAERREIIRILTAFSDVLRPRSETLLGSYDFLGLIDFNRAKARLALAIHAVRPVVKPIPLFGWRNARHPLLFLSLKEHGREVVPMDLELNSSNRILVISGPNAGGKSVCLKTAGLLQYMLQSGLLVPMEEDSEAGTFSQIFLDIGDEQSLENDLSTYSSHLMGIRYFIEHGDRSTLFLIDEFGTGTEPQLGGAIAEASLYALNRRKAFGVVTTHYANIKAMAAKEAGIINAAMLFDTKEMKPLYILQTGRPGSSFAFEIARQRGFPEEVLEHAASITGYSQIDFEKQLQELETEKMHLEREKEKYGVADTFLSEMIDKYEKLIDDVNGKKAAIIEASRREADEILSGANRLIERTIKEIREAEAEKERTKELRSRLKEEAEEITGKMDKGTRKREIGKREEGKKEKGRKGKGTKDEEVRHKPKVYHEGIPVVGDRVEITAYGTTGELVQVKGKTATVLSGAVSIRVPVAGLRKISKTTEPHIALGSRRAGSSIMSDLNRRAASFKLSLDLRGKRAAEALETMRSYLDDAILLSIKEVSILHGKGDGILRKVIREYLQSVEEVEHFGDEHVDRGGQGITVVKLR